MIRRLLGNSRKLDLTEGNTVRNIWALALPMMLGNIMQTAFNVVDMIWVGRLGSEAIASVAMSGVVLFVIITLIIGVSTGTQTLVARFMGAGKCADAENVAMQSLIIGAVLSVALAGAGLILARPILQILGAKTMILQLGTDYLKIILIGGLGMVYLFLACAIFRASGDALTPMLIMIGATILNVILDPLMIFGIGFPRMGVKGAALATVLSRGLAALLGLYILFRGSSRLRLHLAKLQANIKTIARIVKIGFPNSIQMASRSIVGLVLMAIVARYGSYAIAAYGIGLRIFSVVLMPGFALATSAAILVGQNLGARKFLRAQTSARQAAGFNTLLMGLAGILFFTFSANLISVFDTNPDIVKLGAEYLKITSFGYIFVAQGLVLGRSLMGAGDTISPMLISVFALLGIQIPLAVILPNHLHIGISGVWWAILISSVLQGALTCFWFNLGRWKGIDNLRI
ncbi:MAG: MATE family efflux transporter [Candidatus Omnitrophica bacterium]|nr:MATE family efflux transporter [Candidatus Omnitrophota bacterium]